LEDGATMVTVDVVVLPKKTVLGLTVTVTTDSEPLTASVARPATWQSRSPLRRHRLLCRQFQ
jgi:ethanolamine utilization protein EutQ (cupin superfamily)